MTAFIHSRQHACTLAGVFAIALAIHTMSAVGQETSDATAMEPADKVASAKRDIWVLSPGAAGPHRLTTSGDAHSPAWSPDGRRLACLSNGKLWLIDTATDERTCLYAGTDAVAPTWSPDGYTIVFGRFAGWSETQTADEAEEGIWAVDPTGANLRRLLSYAAPEAAPSVHDELWAEWGPHLLDSFAFSPHGRMLAFAYQGESAVPFVAALDRPASPTRAQVIARSPVSATDFCWLEDSQHLLLADGGAEGYVGSGLNVVEAATGDAEVLLPHPYGIYQVAYSAGAHTAVVNWPDGDAYTSRPPWTRDDVCLVDMLEGRIRSGPDSPAWGSGITAVARFPGQHVVDLQLGGGANTVYVLAEHDSGRLYRVTRDGSQAVLGEGVRDFAVWSPAE